MNSDNERELGVLSTKIARLEMQMDKQDAMLREIRDAFVSLRGGWRLMLILSSFAGAGIGWVLQILPMWHK